MNKYKITYSVTIEAESHKDAIDKFFGSAPTMANMGLFEMNPAYENIETDERTKGINTFILMPVDDR